jgi:hypothetical protein
MMKLLFGFILSVFTHFMYAQNLVPNSSFEQHTDCIYNVLSNALPWNSVCGGTGHCSFLHSCKTDPYGQTPYQFYDACFQSYQVPRTGFAYAAFGTYIQSISPQSSVPFVRLIDTLKNGKTYCVTYFVSLLNYCNFSIDKLGALFVPTTFPIKNLSCNSSSTISIANTFTPQVITTSGVVFEDTLNWMEVSGTFTAVGNEVYLAIGDLLLNSQHFIKNSYPTNCNGLAEYYVDDVSVEEVEIAKAKNDTLIYATDSVVIGNNANEAALFSWQPTAGLSCTNCPNPKASPNVTTTYTITKTQCKAVTSDVITITVSPVGINEFGMTNADLRILPNPSNDLVTITSRFDFEKVELLSITGQVLLTETINSKSHQLQLQNFAEGIYFAKVVYPNGLSVTKKIIKQ